MTGTGTMGLLDLLRDAQVDDARSLMHDVTLGCGASSLAALSATSRWHRDHCQARLMQFHEKYVMLERELAQRLGYFYHSVPEHWQLLTNVRALTIPDNLPGPLRKVLGMWLRAEGRLAQVSCIRCRLWICTGEVMGWIELEPLRAGEPQRMSPQERYALEKLDTPDGLLKTVLKHAHLHYGVRACTLCKGDLKDL